MKSKYDEVFIGCSLAVILKALLSKKKTLIIEKSKYCGGAWRNSNQTLKKIDLGCHLIATQNRKISKKISNFFKKYGLNVRPYNKNELFYDSDKWMAYGKTGPAMLCEEGWSKLLDIFLNLLKKKKNIKILKNTKVSKIDITGNTNKVYFKNKWVNFKRLYFPTYCDLNYVRYNNSIINLPYKKINNIHYVIYIKSKKNNLKKNFQGFWDKNKDDIFDRLTVSSIKNLKNTSQIIICCRLRKIYKKKVNFINKKKIKDFLITKKLSQDVKVIRLFKVTYQCPYRDFRVTRMINKKLNLTKGSVSLLDTKYMGHFIAGLIK